MTKCHICHLLKCGIYKRRSLCPCEAVCIQKCCYCNSEEGLNTNYWFLNRALYNCIQIEVRKSFCLEIEVKFGINRTAELKVSLKSLTVV